MKIRVVLFCLLPLFSTLTLKPLPLTTPPNTRPQYLWGRVGAAREATPTGPLGRSHGGRVFGQRARPGDASGHPSVARIVTRNCTRVFSRHSGPDGRAFPASTQPAKCFHVFGRHLTQEYRLFCLRNCCICSPAPTLRVSLLCPLTQHPNLDGPTVRGG